MNQPSYEEILSAADIIKREAVRTPLLESPLLNDEVGGRVLIKPESLQRTGSFKFRGAFYRMSQLSDEERARGVVAYSSGNHAQGVAAAAKEWGIKARIYMPETAPRIKIENTQYFGAEVIFYNPQSDNRVALVKSYATETGATIVPPYDDPFVITGQGTIGIEITQQLREKHLNLDQLLVCCGGGGLIAGIAIAVNHDWPDANIYAVESDQFPDMARFMKAGGEVPINHPASAFCDALLVEKPGHIPFAINQEKLKGCLAVSDEDVRHAMRYAFRYLKLIAEPGGAVALASVLAKKIDCRDKVTVLVISGGNVDPKVYAEILQDS